jgi:hypothetical protein
MAANLYIYTAFHIKLPFLELDYTASAKCLYQSHHSMDSQQKKEHLMKIGIFHSLNGASCEMCSGMPIWLHVQKLDRASVLKGLMRRRIRRYGSFEESAFAAVSPSFILICV